MNALRKKACRHEVTLKTREQMNANSKMRSRCCMSFFPFGGQQSLHLQQLVVWTSPLPKATLPRINFSESSSSAGNLQPCSPEHALLAFAFNSWSALKRAITCGKTRNSNFTAKARANLGQNLWKPRWSTRPLPQSHHEGALQWRKSCSWASSARLTPLGPSTRGTWPKKIYPKWNQLIDCLRWPQLRSWPL